MSITYRDAGVDIDEGDRFIDEIAPLVKSTNRPEVVGGLGGFSGLFAIPPGKYKEPLLVASTDGVGTKLKIAQILGNHATIGIDLVAMCVNDVVVCGAEPLFFLDYFATGRLETHQAVEVVRGIVEGCRQAGCSLLGGETAEMPGFYPVGEYDLAGFTVGVVERDKLLGTHRVKPDDVVLGLASTGIHSNGYSLVRKALVEAPGADLDRVPEGFPRPLGETLLAPTQIYVRVLLDMMKQTELHALAHITGSGMPGNIPRVIPEELTVEVRRGSWPVPPVFGLLQQASRIDDAEMFRTFNMGIGMAVVLPAHSVSRAQDVAKQHQIPSFVLGRVRKRASSEDSFLLLPPSPA